MNDRKKMYSRVNVLSIGPLSLSDKNWEGLTGCPCLSIDVNYKKNQCRSDKTVILNALTDLNMTFSKRQFLFSEANEFTAIR